MENISELDKHLLKIAVQKAEKLKGKKLKSIEYYIVVQFHNDNRYEMYLSENKSIGFKLK